MEQEGFYTNYLEYLLEQWTGWIVQDCWETVMKYTENCSTTKKRIEQCFSEAEMSLF